MLDGTNPADSYRLLSGRLAAIAASAPLTLCGMSACVDARILLAGASALIDPGAPDDAAAFGAMLKDRARRGVGGEVRVDWPDGPAWLAAHVPATYALGGVGPQAAWVLSTLGAPALVNLEDRSRHMLDRLPPAILVAEDGRAVRADALTERGARRPDIYIFEYQAGVAIGDVVPTRSSRIIVRFYDPGLEHDGAFDALSLHGAATAGAGLVAGFNAVPEGDLDAETTRVFAMTRAWAAAGLDTVHHELSGYDHPSLRDRVLAAGRGAVTSLGMSHSEFLDLSPEARDPAGMFSALRALGERLSLDRVCIHADDWAASVTRRDPETEEQALMAGCLVAATRAATGRPARPDGLPEGARFAPLPFGARAGEGGWHFVAVPSPYLERPATTLGLGDTFTAGCLLVLGATGRLASTGEVRRAAV
ncbi:ADP-dependent glucokinase/phosphofructokinase [Ensifer soli]|uniref:ADP-dependent glucokinase/phosphofructokinase n=1 Tax=Ciceribacter sp. sgz301302 TaxID=3342379 RepID=UPI0035B80C43